MSHIQNYEILESCYKNQLEQQVNDYIKDGWELSGELKVKLNPISGLATYMQVMIKLKNYDEIKTSKYID